MAIVGLGCAVIPVAPLASPEVEDEIPDTVIYDDPNTQNGESFSIIEYSIFASPELSQDKAILFLVGILQSLKNETAHKDIQIEFFQKSTGQYYYLDMNNENLAFQYAFNISPVKDFETITAVVLNTKGEEISKKVEFTVQIKSDEIPPIYGKVNSLKSKTR